MHLKNYSVFALIFFHLLARKPNLEKFPIYANKFFHNFYLSESSFTCPELRASGIVQRLYVIRKNIRQVQCIEYTNKPHLILFKKKNYRRIHLQNYLLVRCLYTRHTISGDWKALKY